MKISVAMAYYNGGTYIEEQMDSILSQLGEKDEVIVSVDGASDGSKPLLLKLSLIHIFLLCFILAGSFFFTKDVDAATFSDTQKEYINVLSKFMIEGTVSENLDVYRTVSQGKSGKKLSLIHIFFKKNARKCSLHFLEN